MSTPDYNEVQQPGVHLTRQNGAAIVVLRGDIDLTLRSELQVTLAEAVAADRVIIDLRPATFIDSTTINALLIARRAAKLAGVPLALTRGAHNVMRTLEIAGVTHVFDITSAGG